MSLSWMTGGEEGRVQRITGGRGVRTRLAELGFVVGEPVRVITMLHGNLIVELKGSRVALGQGIAHHVWVTPIPSQEPAADAVFPGRRTAKRCRFGGGHAMETQPFEQPLNNEEDTP